MGKTFKTLKESQMDFIRKQKLFFVGTAPLSGQGRVNISPKGYSATLHLLDESSLFYYDFLGSGCETVAHVQENQRVTLLFCAFEGAAMILRVYGIGEVLFRGSKRFNELKEKFPIDAYVRSIVRVKITCVTTSCGYSVPYMDFQRERETLKEKMNMFSSEKKEEYDIPYSIDSVPGFIGHRSPSPSGGLLSTASLVLKGHGRYYWSRYVVDTYCHHGLVLVMGIILGFLLHSLLEPINSAINDAGGDSNSPLVHYISVLMQFFSGSGSNII
eukprot:Nk52_evm13s2506 gene=Nk52_evmTU13s2506